MRPLPSLDGSTKDPKFHISYLAMKSGEPALIRYEHFSFFYYADY